ncbi:hypothetical protein IEO21_01165 [Rhodonia placenta]|uniref:Uncharacterized protein n=1 Tax=Rhodonia placenta TaxID=104341 RepID=A0A8H7U6D0_9APHY|nr:hypothetical protein IEO21_01165 [Postia placenta]
MTFGSALGIRLRLEVIVLLYWATSHVGGLYTRNDVNEVRVFSDNAPFEREVFSPPVTSPDASTTWHIGSIEQVTWDTSSIPKAITNSKGKLVLGYVNNGIDEHLDLEHPLAAGFDITQGSVQVVVPNVEPANDYIVALFGDSGNRSPAFTIS